MSKVIYVKTSDTCNLNCDHCFTNGRNGGKEKWDVDKTLHWLTDYMAEYPQEEFLIILHGGEPFLAPIEDLERFIEPFIDDPRVILTINSNFVFKLDDRKLAFLKKLDSIGTSWDVGIRFENDNQYALFQKNLKIMRDAGLSYGMMIAVNTELVNKNIDEFLTEVDDLKPDHIRLERLTANGNAELNPRIFPGNERQDNWFVDVYKAYKRREAELNYVIVTLDIIEDKLDQQVVKTDTNCRNCEQNLVTMNSDGSLSGCPNAASEKKHAVVDDGVDAFLSSQGRLEEITTELDFNPNCLTCDVFHLCGGDCHRLPWQGDRCGGLKNLLRYVRDGVESNALIPIVAL